MSAFTTLADTLADTLALAGKWLALERPAARRRARGHAGRSGRHLALLAWALPPNSNAGVHRPLSFLRYGPGLGWRIDAFQGEVPDNQRQHGAELLAQVPAAVGLHVVPAVPRAPSYRFFPRIDGGFKNALAFAQAAIARLAGDPPDVVLASGPPFFVFVAALFTARRFGVPLVLDYRDEWSECPFDFVTKGGHDGWWERRCLAAADAVLFTTESHRRHQLATFPELRPECAHRVPNGWEPDDFLADDSAPPRPAPASTSASASARGPITLAHVGNLAGHTPPHDFLASLAQLLQAEPAWQQRLKVQLIGRRSPAADEAIRGFAFPQVLEVVDHVSKREANQRMQASDALLLIATPDLERYLPGKLFDYLAARRPVLVFGSAGESQRLLDGLGAGLLCAPGDAAALGRALQALADIDMAGRQAGMQAWLAAHRRDVLAAQAFAILNTLTR